jgi:hypothetical protein
MAPSGRKIIVDAICHYRTRTWSVAEGICRKTFPHDNGATASGVRLTADDSGWPVRISRVSVSDASRPVALSRPDVAVAWAAVRSLESTPLL